jgi:predicted tellurium resistance membrane protein TerC
VAGRAGRNLAAASPFAPFVRLHASCRVDAGAARRHLKTYPATEPFRTDARMFADLAVLAADPTVWAALVTLIALEIVLGIDNLIFISILTNKLPEAQRANARRWGIGMALGMRLALLGTIAVIVKLTEPVFTILGQGLSWRDLILIAGGLFLVWKATKEIHHNVDPTPTPDLFDGRTKTLSFGAAIAQILVLDLVFSIDSIITAVGMTPHVPVMVIAVVVTVGVMLLAADPLAKFIEKNPTLVMLALAFLLMIGMVLIAEGFGAHVPKGYIYAAMAFSVFVEMLNIFRRKAKEP